MHQRCPKWHDVTASQTMHTHAAEGLPRIDIHGAARRTRKRMSHPPAGRAPWVASPVRRLEGIKVVQVPSSVVLQCHHWRGQGLQQLLVLLHKLGVGVCGMVLHRRQKLCEESWPAPPNAAGPVLQGVDGTTPAGCQAYLPHQHSALMPVARCCTSAKVFAQPFGIHVHGMVHREQYTPQAAWQLCLHSSRFVRNAGHVCHMQPGRYCWA